MHYVRLTKEDTDDVIKVRAMGAQGLLAEATAPQSQTDTNGNEKAQLMYKEISKDENFEKGVH
uniref:RPN2_C domain-containing protein n=1 Tax=Heterorhabditis bacteriophora TaxID=37862 RepID=A0A1I7X202_HETBA